MSVYIDDQLRPDLAAEQVYAATETAKTNRLYGLNDFLKTRPVFPGTEEKPDKQSEELYRNAFDMVCMAIAALACDSQDWVEREQEARDERE